MRNPVGPLPSSIYWRRRAVAVLVIALLAALAAWAVTSGGGSGGAKDDGKPGGSDPAPSITPGPSSSGPVVGQPPGGRDESGDPGTGTDGGSAGEGGDTGTGGAAGSDTAGAGGSASAGASAGTGGGTGGQQVPAGSSLPNCTPAVLQLSLKTDISYAPDDKPKFRLSARNTSAADCKADFGPKSAVLTITEAGEDDEQVWSSKDCPKAGALFLRVPAGATVVHTVEWDRKGSAPRCATPPVRAAAPGTYLLEAEIQGETVQRASFVLAKD
ncbi:hypothetical protein ACFWFI_23630 [Streptomyces sp. NPDC060209]|uniref:hypothetical protein n=1 Tax=Streptomyces sp. NPDC060209 TaxID=3347073 RepID=UPI00365B0B54